MDLLAIEPNKISENLSDKTFLFYGEAGTRKTTVASHFPGSIIAAFEVGYSFISDAMAQPIRNWNEFRAFLRELERPEVKERFKTVVIDTATIAYSMCSTYVLSPMGAKDPADIPYGKGYRAIRREFESAIMKIPQLGYGLILIAHADEIVNDDGQIMSKVDIDKRPAAIIKGLADFILYLRKDYKEGAEQTPDNLTVYAYSNLMNIETKTRSRYFPSKFEFTFNNLEEAMKEAIAEQKRVEGITTVDKKENPHELQEIDFELLQTEVIEMAAVLLESDLAEPAGREIMRYLPEGVRISQTTIAHQDNLLVLRDALLELKSKLQE